MCVCVCVFNRLIGFSSISTLLGFLIPSLIYIYIYIYIYI